MNTQSFKCPVCEKQLTVDIDNRTHIFCSYCAAKIQINSDENKDIKKMVLSCRDPLEKWALAEELYNRVEVEQRH